MSEIAQAQATVADKIRALASAGVPRADIARFLGKRYQHVRNVLEGDAQSSGYVVGRADLSGLQEVATPFESDADDPAYIDRRQEGVFWLRIRPDGSMPLPNELAQALDARPGSRVFAKLEERGKVTVVSGEMAMRQAQEIVRRYVPEKGRLVDDFLKQRRAMWGEADD